MKPLYILLFALLTALQYMLWFSPSGVAEAWNLHHHIAHMRGTNAILGKQNAILVAEVKSLKYGNGAVEARARNQLGMIKPGEVFYQVVS